MKLKWYEKLGLWAGGALFVIWLYGMATDCPGTAGYSYCSPIEMHRMKYGY